MKTMHRLTRIVTSFPLFLHILIVVANAASTHTNRGTSSNDSSENLYTILGVPTTSPIKEIKSAYRRKARDTHPDKNRDVSPEVAAAEFHKVVHAFEVLSDVESRRRYDGGWGDGSNSNNRSGRSSSSSSFHWQNQFFQQQRQRRPIYLKDRFEVKQAQSRVLHVVSLDQLRTIMLDDDDRLERHLLLCFFTPNIERLIEDEIVYPYPFAGMSPQSIWWEDLLQTVSIRFHRENDLTRYFNIDGVGGGDGMTAPVFLFVKKGTLLGETFNNNHHEGSTNNSFLYTTKDREAFETWMWSKMEVQVTFRNDHAHPVQLYWISGTRAHIKETIPAGHSWVHYSMLTHEFYARDARVDAWPGSPGGWKLTSNSSLGSWKIGVEVKEEGKQGQGSGSSMPPIGENGSVVIDIPRKDCSDLSGHCQFWAYQNQCGENPSFMNEKCMLTCGHCSNDTLEEDDDQTCDN